MSASVTCAPSCPPASASAQIRPIESTKYARSSHTLIAASRMPRSASLSSLAPRIRPAAVPPAPPAPDTVERRGAGGGAGGGPAGAAGVDHGDRLVLRREACEVVGELVRRAQVAPAAERIRAALGHDV